MTQEERSKGLELIGLGGTGLLLLLLFLGGGLWSFAPDLEDGRPPRGAKAMGPPGPPVWIGVSGAPPAPPATVEASPRDGGAPNKSGQPSGSRPRIGTVAPPPLPAPPPGHRPELPAPPPNPPSEPPSTPAPGKPEAAPNQPPSS